MKTSFPSFSELERGPQETVVLMDFALAFMFRAAKDRFYSVKGDSDFSDWLEHSLHLNARNRVRFCKCIGPVCLDAFSNFSGLRKVIKGSTSDEKLALLFLDKVQNAVLEGLQNQRFRDSVSTIQHDEEELIFWSFIPDNFYSQPWQTYFKKVLYVETFEFLFGEPMHGDELISDEPLMPGESPLMSFFTSSTPIYVAPSVNSER